MKFSLSFEKRFLEDVLSQRKIEMNKIFSVLFVFLYLFLFEKMRGISFEKRFLEDVLSQLTTEMNEEFRFWLYFISLFMTSLGYPL